MNRKSVASLPVRAELLRRAARPVIACTALLVLLTLAACGGGGAPTTVNQQSTPPSSTANAYTGPAAANADVQAFKINLWENIRPANRCGGCHHQGGQSPMFARSDDVNLAYQAAGPLVNLVRPDQSTLVLKVGSGHNCWVADPSACAATMLVWIQAWIGAGSASTTSVQLTAPPVQAAGGGKQFPADSTSFQATVYPLLRQFCSGCHTSSSATAQQPYFASANPDEAYAAAQQKINLASPNQSRFYVRLAEEFHHCWVTPSSGGAPDCPGSSATMLAAITAFANGIPVTQIDPNLVISNALALKQGTVAAGGNRFEANLVAKYMFQTGSGSTAYDTSGVTPAADLSLSGNVSWVGGWGISVGTGERRADQRLHPQLLRQQRHARCHPRPERHAVRGTRAQQHHRYQRHAAPHDHHGERSGPGGAAARGADLRSGQRAEDLRQRHLYRGRGSGQGRLARQLGQHLRAGARQRDHRSAPVAGRHQVRRHSQPRAHGGADPAELRRRRWREVLPAVRRQRSVGRVAVVHPVPGESVRQLQLPVLPAEVHQPRSQGGGAGESADRRHAPRRERRTGPGRPGLRHPERQCRRRELHRRQRSAAVGSRHRDPGDPGTDQRSVLPVVRPARFARARLRGTDGDGVAARPR